MIRDARLHETRRRRLAARAARTGAVLCAAMLALSAWAATDTGLREASAAPIAGIARIGHPDVNNTAEFPGGGSDTDFAVRLPTDAACTGDSASDEYRVQSYMVPSSVDPATLTYGSNGPLPAGTGADFRQPLYDTAAGTPYVNAQTDIKLGPDQGGVISGMPVFDFHVYGQAEGSTGPELVPEGTYNVGIACTLGPPSSTQIDKYWNVQISVKHDADDKPAGFTWTVLENPAVATTVTLAVTPPDGAIAGAEVTMTASVVPSDAGGTVTFRDGAEATGQPVPVTGGSAKFATAELEAGEHQLSAVFTPDDPLAFLPSTSDTVTYAVDDNDDTDDDAADDAADDDADDSIDDADDASDDDGDDSIEPPVVANDPPVEAGSPGGAPGGTGVAGAQLPRTGGSTTSMVVWAALLVIFGRMAVLLGRPPTVIPAGP